MEGYEKAIAIKDDKALTRKEFGKILLEIELHHSFGHPRHKNWVKYIRPNFDMRDGKCFNIKLDNKEFDSRECKTTMYKEIMEWLKRD